MITPTYCQPVDADGVGKCPTPCPTCESCPELCKGGPASDCAAKIGALPSVAFKANSNKLDDNAKAALSTAAARLRNNPGCKIVVIGYCSSTKKEQQLSWDHVNAVINYMVDKEGISADRFIFNYGQMVVIVTQLTSVLLLKVKMDRLLLSLRIQIFVRTNNS